MCRDDKKPLISKWQEKKELIVKKIDSLVFIQYNLHFLIY